MNVHRSGLSWQVLCLLSMNLLTAQTSGVQDTLIDTRVVYAKVIEQNQSLVIDTVVTMDFYFRFMDSLVAQLRRWGWSDLNEHMLVRFNPWLLEVLANTDYYILTEKGLNGDDPLTLTVLQPGDVMRIPDTHQIDSLHSTFNQTWLDLNVPEFAIRIMVGQEPYLAFSVRVGRNEKKFLAMAGREVDLRTKIGQGRIVSINRYPDFINPVDNVKYTTTRRDDNRVTRLPRIPFLEPEINGIRYGQMIHPTTNPVTLGKAYSNGCIGVSESAAWYVYYYAPVGTKIRIRYDLEVINPQGDTIVLPDIYHPATNTDRTYSAPADGTTFDHWCFPNQVPLHQNSKS